MRFAHGLPMDVDPTVELVTCSIEMCFEPDVLEDAVRMLLSTVGRTEAKSGCRECAVARDAIEEGKIRYSEVWSSQDGLWRHARTEEFRIVLLVMDLCREEPKVMIGDLIGRSGIAHLRNLREGEPA